MPLPPYLAIYPLGKGQELADKHLRLGPSIDPFEATIQESQQQSTYFEFDVMAIIEEPEGRKRQLYSLYKNENMVSRRQWSDFYFFFDENHQGGPGSGELLPHAQVTPTWYPAVL